MVRLLIQLCAVLALALSLHGAASARELTESEKQALVERVRSFNVAMQSKDIDGITSVVPAKVYEAIATESGVTPEALLQLLRDETAKVFTTVTFEKLSMDTGNATYKETPDGTPYALIPTETVMAMEGGKIKATSQTFAMLDEGVWYLVRTDDTQTLAVLRKVYPAYAQEEFPAGTMESVTP